MVPIDFKESTKVLGKPSSASTEECGSLPVYGDGKQCMSCWKASWQERLYMLFTGKVWIGVVSGSTQPPIYAICKHPFAKIPFVIRVKESVKNIWKDVCEIAADFKRGFKQPDKRKHFAAGFIISLAFGTLYPSLGLILGSSAGIGKEVWDSKGHGTVENMDAVFTCLGAACAYPFALLLYQLIF